MPGALLVVLSFRAGGFFPGPTALVVTAFVLALTVRITSAARPVAGVNAAWIGAAALLALYAIWTLISSSWSQAPARAVVEYDRALLYMLAFVTFGMLGYTEQRLRWLLRGLALGATVVCVCALITRLAPDFWTVRNQIVPERLSYPLTYWNALGLLAALGCIFCFGLTTDAAEPRGVRVLAAGAFPLLSTTAVLTFSRGSIAAGVIGLALTIVLARPSLLLAGIVAAGPASAIAVESALDADLLATTEPMSAMATGQGHRVALTLAACTVAAMAVRALALRADRSWGRLRARGWMRRRSVVTGAALAVLVLTLSAFAALDGTGAIERQVDAFSEGDSVPATGRSRLSSVGNNGRLEFWRVAVSAFEDQPLRGVGAGSWALEWDLRRTIDIQANDGHSLYLEVLAELGIPGLVLIAGALLLVLGGLAARARGEGRGPGGVLCAAVAAWALSAGIDWQWELPAVTLWVFAAGGMALAAAPRSGPANAGTRSLPRGTGRVLVALACLVLALAPLSVLRSDGPLGEAQRAFARGDCRTATDRALASRDALGSRPEPYYILGLCNVRAGYGALAVSALEKAVARDPRNWEYRYGLALVRGADRRDPRSAAREALRLNPREPLAADAVRRFATNRPDVWRRRALRSRLPSD